MLSKPNYVTSFNTSIFAIAGYYTNDGDQHVIAAANDGNVYQVIWRPDEVGPGGYQPPADLLGHFDGLVTIAGFFTPDDNFHHAVGTTAHHFVGTTASDGKLHELYYNLGESPHKTDLPYHISSFVPRKGMASFYSPISPSEGLRHVVIVDHNGNPVDITWNANRQPNGITITISPTHDQVASISGFLATDDNSRHIIVARNDTGQIYDIAYPDERHVPHDIRGHDNIYVKTTFEEPLKNVTAFFCPDNHKRRHIVVLTQANLLKLRAYDITGGFLEKKQLTSLPGDPATVLPGDVADITSFYNDHDSRCHVVYATKGGNLYEITYTSQ